MKVLIVLCLAVASTCALNLRGSKFVDISPVLPFYNPETRITNGLTAKPNQFPYQVGMTIVVSATEYAFCGGSLIAKNYVLTAAHCTSGYTKITVYLGSINIQSGTSVSVSKIIVHPQYNAKTLLNDISLLNIPAVTLTDSIKVVPLPAVANSYPDYVGQAVVASGWGLTEDGGNAANVLQYANMTIVSNSVCSGVYGSSVVTAGNICLSTPKNISTCSGDSGGPHVLQNTGVLVGVTSFGAKAGCTLGYPVGLSRVTSFRKWIQDNSGV